LRNGKKGRAYPCSVEVDIDNRRATDRPLEAHFIGWQRWFDFGTLAAFIARCDAEVAE
jgi:hypothetical protein